ncbi:hypothetical protein HPO96_08430 [Kribbella sandramycini]|uniref:Uncharacterized protein n=1 Tax=Kribbella sandramycini TaxID=60450 RepID=A0A7Y4KX43_9ACTN|nr:hypothetical protein [Kribbella sandramycini]MBB6569908.1 hypothetical protein [Kribbella sandramycini]NOL40268.1 hypothetical protein [Kribbella sandramycini]
MPAVGGIDTYYDYNQRRWMYRRLGGGPVHTQHLTPPKPDPEPAKKPAKRKAVRERT